jgi:TPP-dependent pyruvate/acetoin dehydrogenase alpha subunit
MRSVRVDGNDVLAVHAVTAEAAARARTGDGPTFIEAVTYRRLGHSSSDDPTRYRDPREVEVWERRDPVERFRRFLQQRHLWSDERERALQDEIGAEVNAAIREAEQAAATPPDDSLIRDVYAETPKALRAQLEDTGAHDEHRH